MEVSTFSLRSVGTFTITRTERRFVATRNKPLERNSLSASRLGNAMWSSVSSVFVPLEVLAPLLPPFEPEAEPKPSSDPGRINLFEGIKIFDPIGVPQKDGAAERDGPKKKKMKKEEGRPSSVLGPEDEKYRLGYGLAGKGVKLPWYLEKPNGNGAGVEDEKCGGDRRERQDEKKKKTLEKLREERLKRERREKDRERALRKEKVQNHRDAYGSRRVSR